MIIIHAGPDDIQNQIKTFQEVRNVITTIKENDVNNEVEIGFSAIIHPDYQDLEKKIKGNQ